MRSEETDTRATVPLLVITGPVGVGKTTVAQAVSELLGQYSVAHAVIDQDWLRSCVPSPPDDPFQIALGLKNLASVWANFRASGARMLILADVVEAQADLAKYRAAVPGAVVTVVRLKATLPTINDRLVRRDLGSSLEWYQQRAAELNTVMEGNAIGDLVVDTDGRTVIEIAMEILPQVRVMLSPAIKK